MVTAQANSMRIVCDRAALVDALAMASGVVASRTPAPVLLCVKLVAKDGTLSLHTTDTEIGLVVNLASVEVSHDGESLVPADKLLQIARSVDDATLTIECERNATVVKGARARFRVLGYDPKEFPGLRDSDLPVEFEIGAGQLRKMINRTVFATAVDNSRFAFNGVLLERKARKIRMVATDGRRMALAKGDCGGPADGDSSCIVPTKALNVLNRLLDDPDAAVRISRERNRVVFHVGDAAVLSSSLIEGAFPPFEDVIPKEHDRRGTFDTAELSAAVKRAALLTNEESKGVRMSFSPERLVLSSRAPEMGDAEIELSPASWEGAAIEVGFNPGYITDMLRIADVPEVTVELKAPNKPGVIKFGNDFTYVLMPVNLP